MTGRLTLLFILASSAVLLALGWVIAASVEQHFEEQDMDVLTGKMELVRHALGQLDSMNDLQAVMKSLDNALVGHHGLEVIVMDSNQRLMFSNSAFELSTAVVRDSALYSSSRPVIWNIDDQTYRALVARVATGQPDAAEVTVAVALDIVHHKEFMASFQRTLWAFIAGAAALAGFLGWAVARHGLAPLRTMREQTSGVTAQRLSYRLPVERLPSELIELARSLNEMLARLEDAFVRLTAFSSDIAHELRTPVSNLMTETQVALSRSRTSAEYLSVLESNAEEYEHLSRMISDMVLLAKADNGLVVPHRERLSLATEVRALFDYYDAVAEDKGVQFTLSGEGQLSADRLMLRRALGNLLSNAIRHAHADSDVCVAIQGRQQGMVIRVENTGDVIPLDCLERVFERFFRVDPSRQHRSEGTGLGLAITKSIVLAHGGTISATSSAARTTFLIQFSPELLG